MALQNLTITSTASSTTLSGAFPSPSPSVSAYLEIVSAPYEGSYDRYRNVYVGDGAANLSYTVQDALNYGSESIYDGYSSSAYKGYYYNLQLANTGCSQYDSAGKLLYNCSVSCMQPSLIFNDTATMANCMSYELISTILAHGSASDDFKRAATTYGISADPAARASVSKFMQSCFRDFCQASKPCMEYNASAWYYHDASYGNHSVYYDGLTICDSIVAPVLTDIAGIGVKTT